MSYQPDKRIKLFITPPVADRLYKHAEVLSAAWFSCPFYVILWIIIGMQKI
jgi:hypothetical protein